jgi:hypothetical protein
MTLLGVMTLVYQVYRRKAVTKSATGIEGIPRILQAVTIEFVALPVCSNYQTGSGMNTVTAIR